MSNFPIILPHIRDGKMGITASTTVVSESNFDYMETRDDYDVHVEEERNRLFAHTSSLSFPIEHYCMMVEKVYISFLKSYKKQCSVPNKSNGHSHNHSRIQTMKAYVLGKRLQVFLREVFPSHIHYHTEFKGRERIFIITSQVDEYLYNLSTDVDISGNDNNEKNDSEGYIEDENNYHYVDYDRSSFVTSERNDRSSFVTSEREHMQERDEDQRHIKCNKEEEEEEGNCEEIRVGADKEDYTYCGSSTSTSYSTNGEMDWDDCECIESIDNNGFILKERKNEANAEESYKESEKKLEPSGFEFKTLISHWKEQEKKWISNTQQEDKY